MSLSISTAEIQRLLGLIDNSTGNTSVIMDVVSTLLNTMPHDLGTVTAGTINSLTDTSKTWGINIWFDYTVAIISGTGVGQVRRIASNTGTALVPNTAFATAPDATSVYAIWPAPLSQNTFEDVMLPVAGGSVHNTTVAALTNILPVDVVITRDTSILRIVTAFSATGRLWANITTGGVTIEAKFFDNFECLLSCFYMFDLVVNAGDSINYQYSVPCDCLYMRVQEVIVGV